MSFNDLDKEQLLEAAEHFGVSLEDGADEDAIRQALTDDGVDFALYTAEFESEDPEGELPANVITSDTVQGKKTTKKAVAKKAAAVEDEKPGVRRNARAARRTTVIEDDKTLIKMTRNNPVYEALGYRWTRNAPFVLVNNEHVDWLIEVEGGFTVAKPSEVEEFYS